MITMKMEPRSTAEKAETKLFCSENRNQFFSAISAVFAVPSDRGCLLPSRPHAQTPQQPATVFRSGTELVLVNVVVRDKNGAVVRGLTRDDFTVTEDDKPQTVTSFDFEELDTAVDGGRRGRFDAASDSHPGADREAAAGRREAPPTRTAAAAAAAKSTCTAGG